MIKYASLKQAWAAGFMSLGLIMANHAALGATSNKCLNVQAKQSVTVTSATTTAGIITEGGILIGTTTDEFISALTATPDPDTFSFTDQLAIVTKAGTLTDNDVTIFNTALGVFSTISPISNGTGIFAGTAGTLFISGSTSDGVHFTDKIVGQICFPGGH